MLIAWSAYTSVIPSRLILRDLRGLLAHRTFGGKTKYKKCVFFLNYYFWTLASCLLRKHHSTVWGWPTPCTTLHYIHLDCSYLGLVGSLNGLVGSPTGPEGSPTGPVGSPTIPVGSPTGPWSFLTVQQVGSPTGPVGSPNGLLSPQMDW